MTVIKAIVNKACSSAVLTKYQELLKAASDAFITNMPYADISSLVQMQLGDWRTGTSQPMPCSARAARNTLRPRRPRRG